MLCCREVHTLQSPQAHGWPYQLCDSRSIIPVGPKVRGSPAVASASSDAAVVQCARAARHVREPKLSCSGSVRSLHQHTAKFKLVPSVCSGPWLILFGAWRQCRIRGSGGTGRMPHAGATHVLTAWVCVLVLSYRLCDQACVGGVRPPDTLRVREPEDVPLHRQSSPRSTWL